MVDDPFADRLKRLEARLEAARGDGAKRGRGRSKVEASALGWRMVTELATGIALGLAIGYGLDSLFGTLPVFLVVFALLGFAAGIRTMLRSVEEVRGRARQEGLPGPAAASAAAGGAEGRQATGRQPADGAAGAMGDDGRNGRARD